MCHKTWKKAEGNVKNESRPSSCLWVWKRCFFGLAGVYLMFCTTFLCFPFHPSNRDLNTLGGESEAIHESRNFEFLEGVFKFGHVVSRSSTALKAKTCFYYHQIKVLCTHLGHNASANHKLKGALCISNFPKTIKTLWKGNTPCKVKFHSFRNKNF